MLCTALKERLCTPNLEFSLVASFSRLCLLLFLDLRLQSLCEYMVSIFRSPLHRVDNLGIVKNGDSAGRRYYEPSPFTVVLSHRSKPRLLRIKLSIALRRVTDEGWPLGWTLPHQSAADLPVRDITGLLFPSAKNEYPTTQRDWTHPRRAGNAR